MAGGVQGPRNGRKIEVGRKARERSRMEGAEVDDDKGTNRGRMGCVSDEDRGIHVSPMSLIYKHSCVWSSTTCLT